MERKSTSNYSTSDNEREEAASQDASESITTPSTIAISDQPPNGSPVDFHEPQDQTQPPRPDQLGAEPNQIESVSTESNPKLQSARNAARARSSSQWCGRPHWEPYPTRWAILEWRLNARPPRSLMQEPRRTGEFVGNRNGENATAAAELGEKDDERVSPTPRTLVSKGVLEVFGAVAQEDVDEAAELRNVGGRNVG
jgi:hypothetical protein